MEKKILITHSLLLLLVLELVTCQTLEKILLAKGLTKLARMKMAGKDKKFWLYGKGAIKKSVVGTVQGVIGKPLKLIGVLLGPLGLPIKLAGGVLKAKSAANKVKAVVLTIKKYARDSVRAG